MPIHTIDVDTDTFNEVATGVKTMEIRPDTGYAIGHILVYREDERTARRRITHLMRDIEWLPKGFVIMAFVDAYGPEDNKWKRLTTDIKKNVDSPFHTY